MIIIQFLLGASLASFFNLVPLRDARGESIVRPRSHCDTCQMQLAAYDLIPVLSYIILIGKCRYCKSSLSATFFFNELMLGIALASLNIQHTNLPFMLSLIMMAFLSSFDLVQKQVPTWGILGLFCICLLLIAHPLTQIGPAFVIYLVVQLINQKKHWVGAGDLDIYFCLWLISSVLFLLWTTFIACIAALVYLIVAPWPKDSKIPFVPFISVGYFVTFQFQSVLLPLIS